MTFATSSTPPVGVVLSMQTLRYLRHRNLCSRLHIAVYCGKFFNSCVANSTAVVWTFVTPANDSTTLSSSSLSSASRACCLLSLLEESSMTKTVCNCSLHDFVPSRPQVIKCFKNGYVEDLRNNRLTRVHGHLVFNVVKILFDNSSSVVALHRMSHSLITWL